MRGDHDCPFLTRYLTRSPGNKTVETAIQRYVEFVLTQGLSAYGVEENVNISGFVGLALLDSIRFGITF